MAASLCNTLRHLSWLPQGRAIFGTCDELAHPHHTSSAWQQSRQQSLQILWLVGNAHDNSIERIVGRKTGKKENMYYFYIILVISPFCYLVFETHPHNNTENSCTTRLLTCKILEWYCTAHILALWFQQLANHSAQWTESSVVWSEIVSNFKINE